MTDTDKKPEAPALKKVRQADEAKKALAEYEAQAIAIREKTARLRALRLAREAETAAIEPKHKPAVRKTTSGAATGGRSSSPAGKRGKAEKRSPGTLADWLNQQDRSGRRT